MTVSVVVPWSGGCEHRERALGHVLGWWRRLGFDVELGHCATEPWCKAAAVADAMERVDSDVLIVADADVVLADTADLHTAITAVTAGVGWAVPHYAVWRWNEEATGAIYAGEEPDQAATVRNPYRGFAGGGLVVLTADTYRQAPLDRRFVGWGQEDASWALALTCLTGEPWRGMADLWHLWHPPAERVHPNWGSQGSYDLHARYEAAAADDEAMAELLEGAR